LAGRLARPTAGGFRAVALVVAIARVGAEQVSAVQTLTTPLVFHRSRSRSSGS
jgi:hypothetical protein